MCRGVWVRDELCQTRGELAKALGVEPIYLPGEWTDDECLCCCEKDATASLVGMRVEWHDAFDDRMVPISEVRPTDGVKHGRA